VPVEWSFPTRVLFGAGAISELGARVRALGGSRALLVVDAGVIAAGLCERVAEVLRREGVEVARFDRVAPNPAEDSVDEGVGAYREAGCDVIVGLGGGAPLDVAKAIRLMVTHTLPLSEYDDANDGGRHITADLPPFVAIPTTAGTGAEVSRSTVISLRATGRKTVIFGPPLIPSLALCDPELCVGLPPRTTATTGMDALTHCVEAYIAKGDHPLCDALAIHGTKLVGEHLARAVEHGDDLDARGGMMKAAMLGAVSFQKGLGACHALAHPLSNVVGLHHGLANALMLPHVLDFCAEAARERLAEIAAALGQPGLRASDAVRLLSSRIGLPAKLSEVGVAAEHIPRMVPQALEDASHRTSPRPCTAEDLEAMYRAAL
jgi:4-hydroxybutyrate dehydrogenase